MADNYYNPNMPYFQYTPNAEEPAKEQEYTAWSSPLPNEDNINAQSQPYPAAFGQDNGFNPYAAASYPQEPYYPTAYPYAPQPEYSQNAPQANYYGGYAPEQPAATPMPTVADTYTQPYPLSDDYHAFSAPAEAAPATPYAPVYNGGAYQPAAPTAYDYTPYTGYQPAPTYSYPAEQPSAPQANASFAMPETQAPQMNGYAVNTPAPTYSYPVEQPSAPQANAPFNMPETQAPQMNGYAVSTPAPTYSYPVEQPSAPLANAPVQSDTSAPYAPHFEENSFTRKYSMPSLEEYGVKPLTFAESELQTEAISQTEKPSAEVFETSSVYSEAPVKSEGSSAFEEPIEAEQPREKAISLDSFVPFEVPAAPTQTQDIFNSLVTPTIFDAPTETIEEAPTAKEELQEETQPPIFSDYDTSFGEQPSAFEEFKANSYAEESSASEEQTVLSEQNVETPVERLDIQQPSTEPKTFEKFGEFESTKLQESNATEQSAASEPAAQQEAPSIGFPQFASFGSVITDTSTQGDFPSLTSDFTQDAEVEESMPDFELQDKQTDDEDAVSEFDFSDETAFAPTDEAENTNESLSGAIERIAAQHETPQNTEEIYKIAEEMSRSVLANSYNRVFNENNLAPSKKAFCLKATGVSADYYLLKSGGQPYLMYDNVDITVHVSSCTALISDVKLASYALSKAIGELADYRSEDIELSETEDGYDHDVLYIGNDSMLPTEFTVMEYLLFALGNIDLAGDNEDYDNEDMLKILLKQTGISDWADIGTKELSHNKRILLLALSAALNPFVSCIIINDPKFNITHADDMLARRVFAKLMSKGKGVLLSSCSEHLMATVANRVIAIRSGRVAFDGSYKQFLDRFCLGIMSFTSSKPDETVEYFVQHHPNVSALTNGNLVYLLKKHEGDIDLDLLLKDALRNGADHRSIVLDEKSFEIASKEVLRGI